MTTRSAAFMLSIALASPALADQLCIKAAGATRSIKIRAAGCKASEVAIGAFDGTTLQLSGINLQIVSGSGATNGPVNGKGNLIIGYDADGGYDRSGSHNLVMGDYNGYSSYGGIVAGETNQVTGPGASVVAGVGSIASGDHALVAGGYDNTASGINTFVAGGLANHAPAGGSSIVGGQLNTGNGVLGTIAGGAYNQTASYNVTVAGGVCNVAGGPASPTCTGDSCTGDDCYSTITGGLRNSTTGFHATVSGGRDRSATGTDDWAAGSLFEDF